MSPSPVAKPRWAPKVRPEMIGKLYEAEASGRLDESLVDAVGMALLMRVESTLHYMRHEVRCPMCRVVFGVMNDPVQCSQCAWQTTVEIYEAGRRHRDLNVYNAQPAFERFAGQYPAARTLAEKMRLIDRLIHEFHWDAKAMQPSRSVGNNLIEGRHDDVVIFLDALSAQGREGQKSDWREAVAQMRDRRRGTRSK